MNHLLLASKLFKTMMLKYKNLTKKLARLIYIGKIEINTTTMMSLFGLSVTSIMKVFYSKI
jgi:hypothetical protein